MQLAEQLYASSIAVFPCYASKVPAVHKGESWKDYAQQHPSTHAWPSPLVGVVCPTGAVIIDLDLYKGVTREHVEAHLGCKLPWDAALIQVTERGGHHYAFQVDWRVRFGDSLDGILGFDTRCAWQGYICTGGNYQPVGFGVFALAHPQALPLLPNECRSVLEHIEREPVKREALPDGEHDVETIREALRHIDPGGSRSEWVRIGLALRHEFHDDEVTGLQLFDQWSAGELWADGCPANYAAEVMESQWASFKPEGATTTATLFYQAIQAGWRPPSTFDTAAAFGAGAAPIETFNGLAEKVYEFGTDVTKVQPLLDEIATSGCNSLQRDLLISALSRELKEAKLLSKPVRLQLDALSDKGAMRPGAQTPTQGNVLDAATPMHPDMWARYHTKGADRKPRGTLHNFQILLQAYGVHVEYNEIAKDLKITGPSVPALGTLHDEAALAYLDHLANLNDYPKGENRAMIMAVANNNTVNPVIDWVNSAPWDGQDHVGQLFGQITLDPEEDPQFVELLFRKWLRGAFAIGTGTTNRFEYVLVMVDPGGGAGKTRFFSTLCPPELRKDSAILDTTNKDSVKTATSYWLVELGELDGTFNRTDQARLKAFLSAENDEIRLPYGRTYLKYPRRTAYFASVNEGHFLVDNSNNRRYWPIRVVASNHQHAVNVQQVWAQAAAEVRSGQQWYLTPEEDRLLVDRNDGFRAHSRIADALSCCFPDNGTGEVHLTVTECLGRAGVSTHSKAELNEAAGWMRKRGYSHVKRSGKSGYLVPEFETTTTAAAFQPKVVET